MKDYLLRYIGKQKKLIVLSFFSVFVFLIANLALPLLVGYSLDAIVVQENGAFVLDIQFHLLAIYLSIALVMSILGVFFDFVFEYTIGIMTQRIVKEIRIEDGNSMFAVPSGTAIENGYVGEYQKMEAIVEYAKSHELRLTEKDLNVRKILPFAVASIPESELEDVVLREGVPDDRTVKITVAGYIRAKLETLLEIPESVTDEDLYNCLLTRRYKS